MTEGMFALGDGCRLRYRWDGLSDGPVLILSNSLGTNLDMWEPQVAEFGQRFRLLRYDTRGHGGSDVPPGAYGLDRLGRDVLELAEGLSVRRFSFCGLSLGGMTGQWLGWRAPMSIERLIIANSSPFMGPPSDWDARIRTVQEDGMAGLTSAVIARWFTPAFAQEPGNVEAVLTGLLKTDPSGYSGCCAAIRDMDMRPVLPLITAPTLIIGGSLDPATPPGHTRQLTAGIPHARSVMLEAAHLSNLERPSEFTGEVLAFLD